eukprot:SAG11_NODE_3897_length_2159_cov_1.950000_2_plen_80_part_00
MGSKSESKKIMEKNGVPCVPGYHGAEQSLEDLKREADCVGYPLVRLHHRARSSDHKLCLKANCVTSPRPAPLPTPLPPL